MEAETLAPLLKVAHALQIHELQGKVEMITPQIKLHVQLSKQLSYDFENASRAIAYAQSTGHISEERAHRYWCRCDIAKARATVSPPHINRSLTSLYPHNVRAVPNVICSDIHTDSTIII